MKIQKMKNNIILIILMILIVLFVTKTCCELHKDNDDKPIFHELFHIKFNPVPSSLYNASFDTDILSLNNSEIGNWLKVERIRKTLGNRKTRARKLSELTPLYPGYGTHFAYVFVGTPPQRQSVIIDTGSHYTAFPCTGCPGCGEHTDAYWDWKKSSTVSIVKCDKKPCEMSASYAEGSSWKAFKVIDKLWVGGTEENVIPGANHYSVDFIFGCQTSETGLFIDQLADGIMGMSLSDDTLASQLYFKHVTNTRIFTLCLREGGGIMTLGGVDERIHTEPGILYARIFKDEGWFNVNLVNILFRDQKSGQKRSLDKGQVKFHAGKETIVDSGTTDTYLPTALADEFKYVFKQMSGFSYKDDGYTYMKESDLAYLPNLVFQIESVDGSLLDLEMDSSSYLENVGSGKYAFRIYFDGDGEAILGANFMNNKNIIFDTDRRRVGFAKSSCILSKHLINHII